MKTFSRIAVLLLAVLGVGALGYYAYILSSETLTFPFSGTERQHHLFLQAVVSPPSFQFGGVTEPLLDSGALLRALQVGGEHPDTVSGEYRLDVRGGYIMLTSDTITKGSKEVRISASEYNKSKTTKYRLPSDLVLIPTDIPSDLSISPVGSPRDRTYTVSMYGIADASPESVRYYGHYTSGATCSISDWGTDMEYPAIIRPSKTPPTLSGEGTPTLSPVTPPESSPARWLFREIHAETVTPLSKNGQTETMTIRLPYDLSASRLCIVAGVSGHYQLVEDRVLEPFTMTGETLDTLSPEYDMKSQIEFRFSRDIYTDTGTLYSPAYIDNRQSAKVEFLKHLDMTPALPITPLDLTLTPDRAILTLPLKEDEKYRFSLQNVTDIYGRTASLTHELIAKSEPFLSIKLKDTRSIYKKGEPIPVKLYALKTPKPAYTLELCKVDLESYSRLERLLADEGKKENKDLYNTIKNRTETTPCLKKELVLARDGYVSPFFAGDFTPSKNIDNGLYVITLADQSDIIDASRFFRPVIFSVVDTNITLKVDASGKMMVLATDIVTGAPLPDQDITVRRNITHTYTDTWNSVLGTTSRSYLPLSIQAYAPGVAIGRTGKDGFLDVKIDSLKDPSGYDSSPYGLSFESWWEYEGRYDSFILESRSGEHLGYVVSTWNDGITGYNFGIKDSDYSYTNRGLYTAYFHTDRKLYLPGEKVYLHAIIRKNTKSLDIPSDAKFDLSIMDPLGKEVRHMTLKPNEFGTISTDFDLPKDASLGSYSVSLVSNNSTEYIENGYTNFQVEIFKNPTFTATVELKSPELEGNILKNLRKQENTDPYSPWYTDIYKSNFNIEGIVKAKYYNGTDMRNTSFTYRVYRSDYYDDSYWGGCFWGCYYEPPIEFYTEGTGSVDADGYGIFRVPVEYSSYYSDYRYTVEITIRDPLSGETVTTPGSLIVKLPDEYKAFAPDNPLIFTPKKKILSQNDTLLGEIKPEYGNWEKHLSGKYAYEIIHRTYIETWLDDIRAGKMKVTTPVDTVVASGTVIDTSFSYRLLGALPGEYHMKITPRTTALAPTESTSETLFYVEGTLTTLSDSALRVIPERTVYKLGETAKVLIQVPFTGATLLITKEKGGVLEKEYLSLTGNTLTKNILIDDMALPNMYIGVVAFRPRGSLRDKTYAVGYGEIVVDISGKKSLLTLTPDKSTYKNRENVNLEMTLTDQSGNPLTGEVAIMVVDESLIRLLGNIDLDIIPKFYQKFPFTVKTSLSLIGIERNRFLSRRGSNGGSGDKGGGGTEISSRTLFKNTAYYNPSVRTDLTGKAKVAFSLPDNITDYRIIAISNTRDSKFAVAQKTIEVRKDYVLETHAPMVIRKGDTFTLTTSIFNTTKRITPATLTVRIGSGTSMIKKESAISLDINSSKSVDMSFSVPDTWKDSIPYTVELTENGKILDSLTQNITLASLPIIGKTLRSIMVWTGTSLTLDLPRLLSDADRATSSIDVSIAPSYAIQMQDAIRSLITYPYGCIEQTISSTLPNGIALSLSDSIGTIIDRDQAKSYFEKGLAKILRMQHYSGGWTYWEGDQEANAYITPYVIRSLLIFRELGADIPSTTLETGVSYIIANEPLYRGDPDGYAEAVWTLALMKNEQANEWWKRIDPNTLSSHGYLAYSYAAYLLGRLSPQIEKNLATAMNKNTSYSYWSSSADRAIYIRFLFEKGDPNTAVKLLDPLVRSIDVTSYYVSTQEKIQLFLTLAREARDHAKITEPLAIALRGDAVIADMALSPSKPYSRTLTSREKSGDKINLKRDDTTHPLYVTITSLERPKDILSLPAYATGGISIDRSFQEIDESRGVSETGEYLYQKPIIDGVFHKGKLYRVTLRASLPSYREMSWAHLSIEDFFPGGWRPINSIFQTESALEADRGGDSYWWDHIESRDDRLLAHMSYGYGDTRTYTYYFRPESLGTYLLPPATAYFMYRPEVHSYTQYQKVKVIE